MNNAEIIVIYQEVGQAPILKKIKNNINVFQELLGGEIEIIPYEEIIIVCKKNRKYLQPNIYVNTKFLSIGETIRGTIVITQRKNGNFISLTKEQIIKYQKFLQQASFNYGNSNTKSTSKINSKPYKDELIREKEIGDNNKVSKNNNLKTEIDTKEVLKMILGIQAIILDLINKIEK